MPLYVPGPSSRSGRTSSQSTGQLMRIWIAIPPGAKDLVTISPLGQFLKFQPEFDFGPEFRRLNFEVKMKNYKKLPLEEILRHSKPPQMKFYWAKIQSGF